MSVQAITSSNTIINQQDARDKAQAFVNLDDHQIRTLARASSYDEKEAQHQRRIATGLLWAVPIVDSLSSGILKKVDNHANEFGEVTHSTRATLGSKLGAVGKTAAFWTALAAGIKLYDFTKKAIGEKVPGVKKFEQQNSGLSFLVDLGVIYAGYYFGRLGFEKLKGNPPKFIEPIKKQISKVKELIDNSSLNTKTLPWLSQHTEELKLKMPKTAGVAKFVLKHSIWITLGTMVGLGIAQLVRNSNKVEKNYKKLKEIQLETAKALDKSSNI